MKNRFLWILCALLSLLVEPVSGLDRACNAQGRAFSEITGYELGSLPPCNTAYKVSRLLRLTVCRMRLIAAIHRKCEGHDRYTALRLLELGVAGKSSAQNSFVKVEVCHDSFLLRIYTLSPLCGAPLIRRILLLRLPRRERLPRQLRLLR